jgi:hypothetical protein
MDREDVLFLGLALVTTLGLVVFCFGLITIFKIAQSIGGI